MHRVLDSRPLVVHWPSAAVGLLCFGLEALHVTLPVILVVLTPTLSPTPTPRPSPTPTPTPLPTSFGPGTWRVGVDIAPGTYEAVGVSGRCEWARLSRLDDFAPAVLFGGNTTRPAAVAILPTDAGFRASEACGRWSLRSPPTPTPSPTPVPPLSLSFQPTTISSGQSHTCALRPNGTSDGSPICWGSSSSRRASAPQGERIASVSSGAYHTCALRPNGSPICWGSNSDGQASPLRGYQFTSISSGYDHTCALLPDGAPVCWGSNSDPYGDYAGQTSPPRGEFFAAISSGFYHTCGLRPDGSAVCWGWDNRGRASPLEDERFAVGHVDLGG